ncbi:competence protein [Streptococcus pneumoniae]|nr:competence protein [Streptococcus pneumoniae]
MEAIIEKIKEYKIIVICTGLGLLVGGFFGSLSTVVG